ncbi:hypothetical protein BTO30_13470 [Domibacillus antri]|uniref:Phage tail protein n=1 Tax=Domibacillus antri TaxID=1714264 RepID=A0A1Q8Q2Z0_9BACI|nr:hypothetical protein [Domibacillus antri]OLN21707.1 hypothetical protein BTO30_13470 [Domibacillus antri]
MESIIAKTPVITIDGKEYTMKRLTTVDAFTFLGVIKKVGLARSISAFSSFTQNKKDGDNDAMIGAALALFLNLQDAQGELFSFFAKVLGTEKETVESMPPVALVEIIKGVLEHPDLKAFTKAVAGLIKVMPQAAGVDSTAAMTVPVTHS